MGSRTDAETGQDEQRKLAVVGEAIAFYEKEKARVAAAGGKEHGDLVKACVEPALRDYFGEVAPDRMRFGPGFPTLRPGEPQNQIDVVFDFDSARWSPLRDRSHHETVPLYSAAMEIRYGGTWMQDTDVVSGIAKMVKRLQTIVDCNVAAGRKCFTSAVFLGPGFEVTNEARADVLGRVLMRLARLYRGNDLSPRLLPGVPRSWPFVDAISLPGVLIKKHTLFSAPSFEASEHPVYLSQPVHVDEGGLWRLRPLATAKGHLRHVLQCVSGRKLFDTPAWTDDEDAVYLGAEPDLDSMARWARGIAVGGAPLPLFHAGGDPADVHWQQFAPDPIVREPLLIWNELRRRAAALHGHRASAR